jgi:uncharacterized membrane protein YcaP (DUF421 family)
MWTVFWQSIVLAAAGTFIIRLGGRKSISQMTIPQLTVIISLGAILGGQVAAKGLAETIIATASFVAFLVVTEWITLKWNRAETVLKGVAIPVISDGQPLVENLAKLRITVDDIEKRLRMVGISRMEDVKTGTIEDNGELGYELMPHARPLTLKDLETFLKANFPQATIPHSPAQDSIFKEVMSGEDSSNIPRQLH